MGSKEASRKQHGGNIYLERHLWGGGGFCDLGPRCQSSPRLLCYWSLIRGVVMSDLDSPNPTHGGKIHSTIHPSSC